MNIDSDTTIAVLKATGAVAAGILGIAGLLADFKDTKGALTKAGRWVLIGIILSAGIGISDTIFEAYKAKSDSKSQAERTEHMLHEISRNLQPITQLSAMYWMEIPPGNKIVDSYIARLSKGIEDRIGSLNALSGKNEYEGLSAPITDSDGNPTTVEITSKSDLWPTSGDEMVIGEVASVFPLTITILKTPIEPESFRPSFFQSNGPGLRATTIMPSRSVLAWDVQSKRLFIVGTSDFDKSGWESNGSIVSVLDLRGAQLIVLTPISGANSNVKLRNDKAWDENRGKLTTSLRMRTLFLRFGEGRDIELSGSQFKKTKYAFGYPIFSLIFPKNDDEFEAFTHAANDDD